MRTSAYIYRIEGQDRIVELSSNWLSFAQENHAGDSCHPDKVLGRPIWDFIAGLETQHLYRRVFQRVRTASKPVTVKFRCDAPDLRRFCKLAIIPIAQGALEFYSKVGRTQKRDAVRLLQPDTPRSADSVRMCGICKKVALSDDHWVEVEAAINSMNLFEQPTLPQITHVTCPDCVQTVTGELEKLS
jgi:hypothetical protein